MREKKTRKEREKARVEKGKGKSREGKGKDGEEKGARVDKVKGKNGAGQRQEWGGGPRKRGENARVLYRGEKARM